MKILRNWTFKWWEIGLLKVCLISLGILLGLYFFDFLANFPFVWWGLFLVTAIYFIIKFFSEK